MAIIVVGGSSRKIGKTALVCGLIRALPEFAWTAVKITSHGHGHAQPVWEETIAGQGTDTARYLAAGARRALLVIASDDALASIVQQILRESAPAGCLIFESNRILQHLRPDLCLAVASSLEGERKSSFEIVEQRMDALVELAGHDHVITSEKLAFHLASLDRISPPMAAWLRERLTAP